jgi:hypothetical protein
MLQVAYRLIDPGSEWRLHREWYERSAMADLLGEGPELAAKDTLYRCLDRLLPHKDALQRYLKDRWQDLFGATFDVLLYDLTSTYFESDPPFEEEDKRRFGYSRDHRFDCVQVVIALIVTPEGLRFKRYWARLKELQRQRPAYSTLLMKLAAMQLLDVHFPTTDGRELVFTRYTQPEPDQQLLLAQLGWGLPEQARPRITAKSTVAV